MKKTLIRVGAFLGGFVIVAIVAFFSMPTSNITPKEALVVISYTGGLCADETNNAGQVCYSEETIYADGTFKDHPTLSVEEITKLTTLIESSNLDSLNVAPNLSCPSTYDGSDVAYTYPTKYAATVYTLCQITSPESDPLLAFTSQLVNRT